MPFLAPGDNQLMRFSHLSLLGNGKVATRRPKSLKQACGAFQASELPQGQEDPKDLINFLPKIPHASKVTPWLREPRFPIYSPRTRLPKSLEPHGKLSPWPLPERG